MTITDEDVKKLKKVFATKDDLKRFATKDDLKRFATKDDLKRFATKDDLEDLRDDIKQEFQTWRSEFYNRIDPILNEVVLNREEREIVNYHLSRNTKKLVIHGRKIKKIEKRLGFQV